MGFQFPLGTVLRVRVMHEEREERVLQQILSRIAMARQAVDEVSIATLAANERRIRDMREPQEGRHVHGAYGEETRIRDRRKELESQLEQLERLREKQFTVFQQARRDREMLTDMQERGRSRYEVEQSQRERKDVDDNFNARLFFTTKRRSSDE